MADVMGHGGDGSGQDPPPPFNYGSGYGHYEEDHKSCYNLSIYYIYSFIINIVTNKF